MLDFAVRDLGCDFYATCFHKWLGGSQGTGMLYVRREMLDRLWPVEPRGIDASPPVFTPTDRRAMPACRRPCTSSATSCRYAWPAAARRRSGAGIPAAGRPQQRIEARIRELAIYARLRLQQLPGIELLTPARPGPVGRHPDVPRAGQDARSTSPLRSSAQHRVYVRDAALAEQMRSGALRAVAAHLQHARRSREARAGACSRHCADMDLTYLMLTGSLSGLVSVLAHSIVASASTASRVAPGAVVAAAAGFGRAAAHALRHGLRRCCSG